jgi:flagellar FliJ protein
VKRFHFSLESVLKVRRIREEKVQREFSLILEKRALAAGNLAALDTALRDMNDRQGSRLKSGGTLDRFLVSQFELSREACIERIGWQKAQLAEVDIQMDLKRAELVEASRQRKVLEKLEERQYQAYLAGNNREEQAFLDELAQFGARGSGESPHPNSAAPAADI